ncbi:hypothetical protein GC194_11605 [bacterium]|nr:hypothetical protein [bacterium]
MPVWSFVAYFLYIVLLEVFINIRLGRLQHAIRILILTENKKPEEAEALTQKYGKEGFLQQLKPTDPTCPPYLQSAMQQQRKTAALRLFMHVLGLVAIGMRIALS